MSRILFSVKSIRQRPAAQRLVLAVEGRGRPCGLSSRPHGWDTPSRSFSALNYVEEMRVAWEKEPSSIHPSWHDFFTKQAQSGEKAPTSLEHSDPEVVQRVASDHIRMLLLVRSYQVRM